MHKLMMLGLAGAVGTLARYGLVSLVGRTVGTSYAWGTLVVNVAGCFLVGAVFALFDGIGGSRPTDAGGGFSGFYRCVYHILRIYTRYRNAYPLIGMGLRSFKPSAAKRVGVYRADRWSCSGKMGVARPGYTDALSFV